MTNSSTEFNDFTSEGHRRPSKHVVLVLDFGSQYSRLIVRRLRAIGAYSELIEISAIRPAAVVLSGGPSSVYEEGAPHLNRDVWELLQEKRVPILGICYGMQEIVYQLGGRVIGGGEAREYGKTIITINNYINNNNNNNNNLMDNDAAAAEAKEAELAADEAAAAAAAAAGGGEPWPVPAAHAATAPSLGDLFYGIKGPDVQVWMSHGDKVEQLPSSFIVRIICMHICMHALASTSSCPYVAAAAPNLGVYTLQFHPEVTHTPCGVYILKNYILRICKLQLNWCMHTYLPRQIQLLQQQIQKKHVIGALSGGVDSTVAAALLYKAIGNQFYAFFIDTGLLRKNEAEETMHALRNCFPDLSIECIDAKDRFINALVDVKDPEQKRKIIGALFIDVFEEAVQKKNIPVKGTLLLQV
ncbi:GMP synthase, putative [Eimeria maxima]|uniref:GMP synthase, putative n=1 Tax=Eimeria maxima TaxID=5804 RepID=U6M913_EIMMA|nr:GMP synthase, putative [Eimeria maxima]CDJ59523.1 GMP synthase, putative [Eimeria maxima]